MKTRISIDSSPRAASAVPFANEIQLQRFVEDHADDIFDLQVISSTRRGGHGLFDIDILAVDPVNTPVLIECKWDLVNAAALQQLAGYSRTLQRHWSLFEKRVSEIRGHRVHIKRREPVPVVIGYRYDPSVLDNRQGVICLTYAYHQVALLDGLIEQQQAGAVSIQPARENAMPSSRHPTVSKKSSTYRRLAPLPRDLQAAFWAVDGRLCRLEGVSVRYGGKNFVRYRVPRGQFAEAKIGPESIEWRFGQPGRWRERSVKMLARSDAEKVFRELRRAHRDAG